MRFCIPFILLISIWLHDGHGQVVNIEAKRIVNDQEGLAGSLGFQFGLQKVEERLSDFSTNVHTQYQKGRNLFLLVGHLGIVRIDGKNFDNNGLLHFRYNHKIGKTVRWEFFTQVQYNEIGQIDFRGLVGTGPRFKLTQSEKFKFYLGTLYMLEYEESSEGVIAQENRMSGYLSFTIKPSESFSLTSTTYYQPRLSDLGDNRFSTENALSFSITEWLSFTSSYSLLHDGRPPPGAPKTVYSFQNGFEFTFRPSSSQNQ